MGLSLGEYSALCFAGAMSFEDGVKVTKARGEAMQAAADLTESGMASVIGLDMEKVGMGMGMLGGMWTRDDCQTTHLVIYPSLPTYSPTYPPTRLISSFIFSHRHPAPTRLRPPSCARPRRSSRARRCSLPTFSARATTRFRATSTR